MMKLNLHHVGLALISPIILGFYFLPPHSEALQQTSYQNINVNMYPLTPSGNIDTTNPDKPLCTIDDPLTEQQNEADTRYGCTAYPMDEAYAYSYNSNPATVSIEADYLLNVVPREMGPSGHHDLGLRSQAIAARSYAYCAIRHSQGLISWSNCNREINNSNSFQVFIPYTFDTLSSSEQARIQDAVADPLYMLDAAANNRGAIFAEFSADAYLETSPGDDSYLTGVSDPISYDPAILGIIDTTSAHQRGMSQNGANRWAWGNSSRLGGGDEWPVHWNDYRQILVHYYTGIDILDGSGNPVAPDDRWNLLNYTGLSESVGANQTISLNLTVQNTSTTAWDDVILGWKWVSTSECDSAWTTDNTLSLSAAPGDTIYPTVAITTPSNPGTYILHLDLKRTGGIWFQDQTPKWQSSW